MPDYTMEDILGEAKPKARDNRTLGQRNNNPGNLRDPATGEFRVFKTAADGWKDLRTDLTAKITGRTKTGLGPTSTLSQFAAAYAPASDKNDPASYAADVAKELNVAPDVPLGRLGDKIDQFARAIARKEGWFQGRRTEQPKQAKATYTMDDILGKPAKTAEPPPSRESAPKPPERHDPWTSSVFTDISGKSFTERYTEGLKWFNEKLPESMRGNYAVKLTEELSKMVPQVMEFATSPAGLALIALHNPYTRLAAAGMDVGLGLQQGTQAVIGAAHLPSDHSPERVAEVVAASVGAVVGVKGGSHVWKKTIPKLYGPDLEERTALREQIKRETDPGKKISQVLNATPKSAAEKIKSLIYRKEGIRDVASWASIPKPRLLQIAADIQRERLELTGPMEHRSNALAYWMRKHVPEAELKIETLGQVIQGDKPESVLSNAGRAKLADYRAYQRDQSQRLTDFYGQKLSLQDANDYVPQIWDMNDLANQVRTRTGKPVVNHDEFVQSVVPRVLMKDRHLVQRKIPSYKFGMEDGIEIDGENYKLKPLFDNVVDATKHRDAILAKAIGNQMQANVLREMGVILSENEASQLGLKAHWKQAPEATALDRASYGKNAAGETVARARPVWVHPDFEMLVNSTFDKPYGTQGAKLALDQGRAVSKKSVLSLSLFHHHALSEQGHAVNMFRANPLTTLKQTFFLNPHFLKGARMGIWEVTGKKGVAPYDPPAIAFKQSQVIDALESGFHLQTRESEAAVVGWLKKAGEEWGPAGKTLTSPVRLAGRAAHAFDKSLWDFYHQGMMLDSWNTVVADELKHLYEKNPNASDLQIKEVKRAVADHLNNVYGAINMEELLLSPKSRYWFNMLLLAPAWTASNMRAPLQIFENEIGGRLAGKWAAGAAFSWFTSTQLMNYALTGYYQTPDKNGKKGAHFTWDNAGAPLTMFGKRVGDYSENALNIEAGRTSTGALRYIRLGKAFRESAMMFLDPIGFAKAFGSKMGLIPHQIIVQLTGSAPGTGFKEIELDKNKPGTEELVQRIAALTGLVLPFGLREGAQTALHKMAPTAVPEPTLPGSVMGLQAVAGITTSKAARALRMALDDGRPDVAEAVCRAAELNNIPRGKVYQLYKRQLADERRKRTGRPVSYDTFGHPLQQTGPPPGNRSGVSMDDIVGGKK